MLFSRWKLLTGALGLSIGGLATLGGTKPPADTELVRADNKVPPPPSVVPDVVSLPALPAVLPYTPPVSPELPGLPLPGAKPTETKLPPAVKPPKPVDTPIIPVTATLPPTDVIPLPTTPSAVVPSAPPLVPSVPPTPGVSQPTLPGGRQREVELPPMPKPALPIASEPVLPPTEFVAPSLPPMPKPSPIVEAAPTRPATTVVAAPGLPSKFRILLRVGAGDPSFEVRHDDDLVMKVVCEKVDIKSPDKGQGPSNVVATGKVRFVGFGAEGTCDSFSFLAGTGEVSLTGNVNVKVRDKIGRVESELNAEKMQYKLDPNALTGVLKP